MFKFNVCNYSDSLYSMDNYTKAIGIVDPDEKVTPSEKYHVARCHDIVMQEHPWVAPTIDQFVAIMNFAEDFTDDDVVMIHCSAGISRSTATAILLLMLHGADEEEAFNAVEQNRPNMNPNTLILRFADELLGMDGGLIEYHKQWMAKRVIKPVSFAGQ